MDCNGSFALNAAVQETCATRKVNAKKNIDKSEKVFLAVAR